MERYKALVIDASLALKWYITETDTEKALEVRDLLQHNTIPIVPSLFFYEIANVLRYKPEFGERAIIQVINSLHKFHFRVEPLQEELAQVTIDLAYKYGITVYDASYVAISNKFQVYFVTADKKLYDKIVEDEKVLLLKDFRV